MQAALVWEHLPLTFLDIYLLFQRERRVEVGGGQVDFSVHVGWRGE
jgi:hypothetical protein